MGLLQDIIAASTQATTPTAELLRMVRVLAARGQAADLAEWVRKEQAGYDNDDVLPSYRGPKPVLVMARWSGPMRSFITSILPSSGYPEYFNPLFQLEFRQPVTALETMANRGDGEGELMQPWSADAVLEANRLMESGKVSHQQFHALYEAWKPVTPGDIATVLGGVRDRILDLALDLEATNPDLGSVPAAQSPVAREEISAKFNMGIVANQVFVGETVAPNYGLSVTAGDPESLRRYLDATGIGSNDDRADLIHAAEEAKSTGDVDLEKNSRLKSAISKTAAAAGKLTTEAAKQIVTALIQNWLGN